MIKEFKKVVSEVEKLPREEQLRIVSLIKEELKWEDAINKSQNQLSELAEDAIEEYKNRNVSDKDW